MLSSTNIVNKYIEEYAASDNEYREVLAMEVKLLQAKLEQVQETQTQKNKKS